MRPIPSSPFVRTSDEGVQHFPAHRVPARDDRRPRRLHRFAWAVGAAVALAVSACSTGTAPGTLALDPPAAVSPSAPATGSGPTSGAATRASTPSPGSRSARPTGSPSASLAAPTRFPVRLVDDQGTPVTIEAEPRRVVSLTPAVTETLVALGAAERVVATTDAPEEPPEASGLAHVASFGTVDVEQIAALDPDLVVAGGNGYTPPESIASLRRLGIPVVVVYAATVDALLADIALVGRAIGREPAADALVGQIRGDIDRVAAAVRDLPRPRVFYEIDATNLIFGPADRSFLAELVELAGGTPITTGSDLSFEMPLEVLVDADPEVIVLGDAAYGVTPDVVASRPGGRTMTAARTGAIRPGDDRLVTRPGPRIGEGLRALALAIHPGLELP